VARFDGSTKMYESYELRNKQLSQRCDEVCGLIDEIYTKDRFA